jgi:carbonic anhydrase
MTMFPEDLADGFRLFHATDYARNLNHYRQLAEQGQAPRVMLIACADSRVSPGSIFKAKIGEIFTVRNVANLVPPYETTGKYHGVSAALQFAVTSLKVQHIIVMGHSQCGGIKSCLHGAHMPSSDFVSNWMSLLDETRAELLAKNPRPELAPAMLERAGIKTSLANLRSFPDVKKREDDGDLQLHGAHFNIGTGMLSVLNEETGQFDPLLLDRFEDDFKRTGIG